MYLLKRTITLGFSLTDMNRVFKLATELANRNVVALRRCSTEGTSVRKDVPGLSKNVVNVPTEEVGCPGASKEAVYKNPEYFCYHNTSYFEAEVEMKKYRLPQPSSKKKKNLFVGRS